MSALSRSPGLVGHGEVLNVVQALLGHASLHTSLHLAQRPRSARWRIARSEKRVASASVLPRRDGSPRLAIRDASKHPSLRYRFISAASAGVEARAVLVEAQLGVGGEEDRDDRHAERGSAALPR